MWTFKCIISVEFLFKDEYGLPHIISPYQFSFTWFSISSSIFSNTKFILSPILNSLSSIAQQNSSVTEKNYLFSTILTVLKIFAILFLSWLTWLRKKLYIKNHKREQACHQWYKIIQNSLCANYLVLSIAGTSKQFSTYMIRWKLKKNGWPYLFQTD